MMVAGVFGLIVLLGLFGLISGWCMMACVQHHNYNKQHEQEVDRFIEGFRPLAEAYDHLSPEEKERFWGKPVKTLDGLFDQCHCGHGTFVNCESTCNKCSGTGCGMFEESVKVETPKTFTAEEIGRALLNTFEKMDDEDWDLFRKSFDAEATCSPTECLKNINMKNFHKE